jgi:hypothetical protein
MEISKLFRKYDVLDMPVTLEDDKFKIIVKFVNFERLKIIKIERFFFKNCVLTASLR